MRTNLFAAVFAAVSCTSALLGAGVAVEIDVRNSKIPMREPAGLSFLHKTDNNYYWEFYSNRNHPTEKTRHNRQH